ncbi:MAG: hypothetical protein R3F59_30740 [Myxococcota bacterium]
MAGQQGCFALGRTAGELVAMVFGGEILTSLAAAIEGFRLLAGLLRAPGALDDAVASVAEGVSGALGQLARIPWLRRLVGRGAKLLDAFLGWFPRTRRAMAGAKRLVAAACAVQEDELRALVRRVLGAGQDHDGLVSWLGDQLASLKGLAALPSWYDPDRSARENLEAWLEGRIAAWLEGDEEGEASQPDEAAPAPDDGDSPELRALRSAWAHLRRADLREVAEQAVPLVGVPADEDWEDWVERGAVVAAGVRDGLAAAPALPPGWDPSRTVHANAIAALVVPTANALAA